MSIIKGALKNSQFSACVRKVPFGTLPQEMLRIGRLIHIPSRSFHAEIPAPSRGYFDINGTHYEKDSQTNITENILKKVTIGNGQSKLLRNPNNPLAHLWTRIRDYFENNFPGVFTFQQIDDPVVSVSQNFDNLLIEPSHPSRSPSNTYYLNRNWVLRTHMTAHEGQMMASGKNSFIMAGDVYRRDEIDSTHMPVFHQIEGVRIFSEAELLHDISKYEPTLKALAPFVDSISEYPSEYSRLTVRIALADLYLTLRGLLKSLFSPANIVVESSDLSLLETYFPFTLPSIEGEMELDGRKIELFGAGILRSDILKSSLKLRAWPDKGKLIGWAFGLGLERLAMVLHEIPDIRLFWCTDERFLQQFGPGRENAKFMSFSRFPPIKRDISFYLPATGKFNNNDLFEVIREVAGILVESVQLIDEYIRPLDHRHSLCFRIVYRAMDRTLNDLEVNDLHEKIRSILVNQHNVILR